LDPEEDTFLSYWQCAEGLANGLLQVESAEQFHRPLPGIGKADLKDRKKPGINKSLKETLDDLCDELEGYREDISQLPSDEVDRLMNKHAALVQRVKAAEEELSRRHADAPQILGADWDRYGDALPAP
jgi:hypothetical protein